MGKGGYKEIEGTGQDSFFSIDPEKYTDQAWDLMSAQSNNFGGNQQDYNQFQNTLQGINSYLGNQYQVNPNNMISNYLGINPQTGEQGLDAISNAIRQGSQSYDPNAFMNAWMGTNPMIQEQLIGQQSPLYQAAMNRGKEAAGEAVDVVGDKLSRLGAYNSGATNKIASQEANKILQDVNNSLTQQLMGDANQLSGQAMGNLYQSFALAPQIAQQGAQIGLQGGQALFGAGQAGLDAAMRASLANQQAGLSSDQLAAQSLLQQGGMYGDMYNQGQGNLLNYLGMMGQFGTPSYGQAQMAYSPGFLENLYSGMGAVGDLAGGIGSLIPG